MTKKSGDFDAKTAERDLPKYLRRNFLTDTLGKFATRIAKLAMKNTEISGRENIPEDEPFLLISNHFGGNAEQMSQLAEFGDRRIHFTAERHTNFEMSGFAGKIWNLIIKAVQALPIDAAIRENDRAQYRKNGEKFGATKNQDNLAVLRDQPPNNQTFFKNAGTILQRGEPIILYPEGVPLYEYKLPDAQLMEGSLADPKKPAMKEGYRGAELVARMYERKTGKPLAILPVASLNGAFTDSERATMQILPPITLRDFEDAKNSGATTAQNFTDFIMSRIAVALPEDFRGFYADKI